MPRMAGTKLGIDQLSVQAVCGFAVSAAVAVLAFHWLPGGAPDLLPQRAAIAGLLVAIAVATAASEAAQRHATLLLHAFAYGFSIWFLTVVVQESFSPERTLMLFVGISALGLLFFNARALLLFYAVQVALVSLAVALSPSVQVEPAVVIGGLAILTAVSGAVSVSRSRMLLRLSELSEVARRVDAGLALVEDGGGIRWSNPHLQALLGEEVPTGRSLMELLGAEDSGLSEALAGRQGAEADLRRGRQWLSVRLVPLPGAAGRHRTIAFVDDVTARRATLERLLAVVTDAVLVASSAGRLLTANDAAEALLGAAREDLVGEPLVTFLAADGSEDAGHRLLFEVGGPDSQPQTRELRFLDRSGTPIPAAVTAAALPARAGDSPSVLIVIRDARPERALAAERQALEDRLQRAERLESLETLAGRVAHDANNLLVAVMGHAGLVAMQADGPVAERVELLLAAAEQAAQLNAQLLALAGRDGHAAQQLDLSRLVAEAEPLLRAASAPQAALRLELSEDLPPITGDSSRLQQALLSVVRNASEALGGADGTVTIRARAVEAASPVPIAEGADLPPGRYALVEVEDTGEGIPAAVRAEMFSPDFSTRAPGRGLGLASALGILRAHGGGIAVHSEGAGARLSFYLPATPTAVPPPEVVSRSSGSGAVLLVDDDDDVREIAIEALERAGYSVLVAQNGVQCLRLFAAERGRIRIVLLDLNMPGMRGEEILRRLHTAAPEVPVLVTSGYAPQHIDGAAGILHKPYRLRDLIAAVARLTPSA